MISIQIYSAKQAALNASDAGKKYQPCNGSEGEIFLNAWCGECQRDKSMREGVPLEECDDNERCDIIALTHCYSVEDERYPSEWQYGPDGQPRCTAFVEKGQPIPPQKDDRTLDLFAGVGT